MHEKYLAFKKQQERILFYGVLYFLVTFIGFPLIFAVLPDGAIENLLIVPFLISIPGCFIVLIRQIFVANKKSRDFLIKWFAQYMDRQSIFLTINKNPDFGGLDWGFKNLSIATFGLDASDEKGRNQDNVFLYKDEKDDKDFVNYLCFSSKKVKRDGVGNVYITLENDFLFNYLNKNNSKLDIMEWNDFEDLFRIETDNPQFTREVLDPATMSLLYDQVKKQKLSLLRIHVTENSVNVLSQKVSPYDEMVNADYLHKTSSHVMIKKNLIINSHIIDLLT